MINTKIKDQDLLKNTLIIFAHIHPFLNLHFPLNFAKPITSCFSTSLDSSPFLCKRKDRPFLCLRILISLKKKKWERSQISHEKKEKL
jgi:hypothetical protein